jgi:hypothetical protein
MREVLIGSSADAGSSINRMSGSIASAHAITGAAVGRPTAQGTFAQAVLHLLPQGGAAQRPFNDLVDVAVETERTWTERDIVEDRLWERVRPLEDETDTRPHGDRVDLPRIQIDAPVAHVAGNAGTGHEVVQAVQATEQRALPEPDGPMSATIEPRGTGNETSATAGTPL